MISGARESENFDYLAIMDETQPRQGGKLDQALDGSFSLHGTVPMGNHRFRVALIDPQPLTRASIAHQLTGGTEVFRRADDFAVWPLSSTDEFLTTHLLQTYEFVLVVINLGTACASAEPTCQDIDRLMKTCPDIPVVLMSDCQNSEHILSALRNGIRGYIPTALDSSLMIQALRLVRAGGTFIPPSALAELAAAGSDASKAGDRPRDVIPFEFTPRQSQVFRLLRKGKSNKVIAYELGMQESTVKVHVRQIMRKLKATNRTHAAFLAARIPEDGLD